MFSLVALRRSQRHFGVLYQAPVKAVKNASRKAPARPKAKAPQSPTPTGPTPLPADLDPQAIKEALAKKALFNSGKKRRAERVKPGPKDKPAYTGPGLKPPRARKATTGTQLSEEEGHATNEQEQVEGQDQADDDLGYDDDDEVEGATRKKGGVSRNGNVSHDEELKQYPPCEKDPEGTKLSLMEIYKIGLI